jgi:hypothetical protein
MTPEEARAHLQAHADELRDAIERGQAPPSTLARWDYLATAIERHLRGERDAFGVKRSRGAPQKRHEHMAMARQIYPLWRNSLSWRDIMSELADSENFSDLDESTYRRAFCECVNDLVSEELCERLSAATIKG